MKKQLFLFFLITSTLLNGQIQYGGQPYGNNRVTTRSTKSASTVITMPTFTPPKNLKTNEIQHKTFTFAHPFNVDINSEKDGNWNTLSDGSRLWQVTIHSAGAATLNVIFSKFRLPQGGKVFIYNNDMSHIIGAFTEKNNKKSGILPTSPVNGDEITIEYQEPIDPEFSAEISIGKINHDYTDIFNKIGYFGDAEVCEKDITCYNNDIFKNTSRSVIKIIIDGSELMTGTLINNSLQDGTPYIITAAHGYKDHSYNAESSVFVFNYQVPYCFTDIEGNREQSVAGGDLLCYSPIVNNSALDFALIKLSITPPLAYRPLFAGWSRSDMAPAKTYCIHHPNGDVKKISFDDNSPIKNTLEANSISYYPLGHWNVLRWEEGATEGGSSGAGLFNYKGQFIGGLSAGVASCSNPVNDYFYRFDLAWDAETDGDSTISQWLDSDQSNVNSLNNYETTDAKSTMRLTHLNDSSDITIVKNETNGNIAGNNQLGITRFVEKFENIGTADILGFYFVASEGKPTSVVDINIWEGDTYPEKLLYSEPLLIKRWGYSSISQPIGTIGGQFIKDSLTSQESFILLPDDISVTGNYFIGFEIDNDHQENSFGLLLSNKNSEENAFYYDDSWKAYSTLSGYEKPTTLWIEPVVKSNTNDSTKETPTNAMKLWPNPISDGELLNIQLIEENQHLKIYDITGKACPYNITTISPLHYSLNVSALPQGIYLIKTTNGAQVFEKK